MPSPAASVARSTWTSGSCLKDSCAFIRSSRPMPPWMMTTASLRPRRVVMRCSREFSVSRRSVKITNFWGGDLVVGRVLQVLDIFGIECGDGCLDGRCDLGTTLKQLHLPETPLQPLTTAAQGLVDRLRRRREATLEDRERKANRARSFVVL